MEPAKNKKWSGRLDLNQRPLHPQCSALPDCATARQTYIKARGGLGGQEIKFSFGEGLRNGTLLRKLSTL